LSRKSVLPVFEAKYTAGENPYGGGLLFYPVQYEGEEQSHNIFLHGRLAQRASSCRQPST